MGSQFLEQEKKGYLDGVELTFSLSQLGHNASLRRPHYH